jgi:hypothetical protein
MLNPENLVMRRLAGVSERRSNGGPLAGARLKDAPLLFTGAGRTELLLDLLFDVTLAGSSIATEDVRELTRPLVELAEGSAGNDGYTEPPVVRFVWGKYWNIPGVVTAVAERLEYFTAQGAPRRSWLRMRFVRVAESSEAGQGPPRQLTIPQLSERLEIPPEQLLVHEVVGAGRSEETEGGPGGSTERLEEIAHRIYGDPRYWRLIANFNNVDNPLEVVAGRLLRVPHPSLILRVTA